MHMNTLKELILTFFISNISYFFKEIWIRNQLLLDEGETDAVISNPLLKFLSFNNVAGFDVVIISVIRHN